MSNQKKIGRYEVVTLLGRGAMGTVYKAVDPVIERTVAIKTIGLNESKEERAEFEERFYREAKSAGRLNHPNIVTIYDVGEDDTDAYIAMEYLEGESLRELLDSGVVLPIDQICKIVALVASALHYAHENQVVHRDIKPSNIMVTRGRDIKIMDFGIAKISSGSRTLAGTVLGSPKYMAPEQVVGKATDGRTDIFALGAMLYEMLVGTAPFNGDDLNAIMYKILNEEPAPPSTLVARVPPAFDSMVAKAMAKRPEDRYQTAQEFAKDLLRYKSTARPETRKPAKQAVEPPSKSKPAEVAQDATVLLSAHNSGNAAVREKGLEENKTSIQVSPPSHRKLRLLAIPALLIVVIALLWPKSPPREAGAPAVAGNAIVQEQKEKSQPVTNSTGTASPAATSADVKAPSGAVPANSKAPAAAAPSKSKPSGGATSAGVTPVPLATPAAPAAALPPSVVGPAVRNPGPTAAPVAAARAVATVSLAVAPWGEVFVDGKRVGVSPPLATLKLTPGSHTVEIRNRESPPYRSTVSLAAGESLKIKHKFK